MGKSFSRKFPPSHNCSSEASKSTKNVHLLHNDWSFLGVDLKVFTIGIKDFTSALSASSSLTCLFFHALLFAHFYSLYKAGLTLNFIKTFLYSKSSVLWVVTHFNLEKSWLFGGTHWLHLQDQRIMQARNHQKQSASSHWGAGRGSEWGD